MKTAKRPMVKCSICEQNTCKQCVYFCGIPGCLECVCFSCMDSPVVFYCSGAHCDIRWFCMNCSLKEFQRGGIYCSGSSDSCERGYCSKCLSSFKERGGKTCTINTCEYSHYCGTCVEQELHHKEISVQHIHVFSK